MVTPTDLRAVVESRYPSHIHWGWALLALAMFWDSPGFYFALGQLTTLALWATEAWYHG